MNYQTPANTNTGSPLHAATIALGVIIAALLVAIAVVVLSGQASDAASTAPAAPVSQQVTTDPAPATPITGVEKQAPAEFIEATPESATDVPVQAETPVETAPSEPAQPAPAQPAPAQPAPAQPAPAQPAPAQPAPAQPAPAQPAPEPGAPQVLSPVLPGPVPFQATCSTSKTTVTIGETFVISGAHVPSTVSVSWSFEHGDGYVDHNSPSYAYYQQAGTYTVTGIADIYGMGEQRVYCGTVTATEPVPVIEYACTIDNNRIPVNGNTVFRAYSNVQDDSVVYTFHHGDGYSEVANPSYATYYAAGTYNVSVTADYDGILTHVDCGTVTVSAPSVPTCPSSSLIGMTEADADAAVFAQNCTPVTVVRDFSVFPVTGEYVNDRVQLTVLAGFVVGATVG